MRSDKTRPSSMTIVTKRSVAVACAALAILCGAAGGAGAEPAASGLLRVCADPDNMPFSNAEGPRLREQARRIDRREARCAARIFVVCRGERLRSQYDGARGLRSRHGLRARHGSDRGHQSLLLHLLCADLPRGRFQLLPASKASSDPRLKGKRIGFFARTPPSSMLAIHGLAANAKSFEIHAGESATKAADDDARRDCLGSARCRNSVGTGRRLLRAARRSAAHARAAGEGDRRPAHHLRHHHGRAPERAAVEAHDQRAHRLERGRDQRHPAEL